MFLPEVSPFYHPITPPHTHTHTQTHRQEDSRTRHGVFVYILSNFAFYLSSFLQVTAMYVYLQIQTAFVMYPFPLKIKYIKIVSNTSQMLQQVAFN